MKLLLIGNLSVLNFNFVFLILALNCECRSVIIKTEQYGIKVNITRSFAEDAYLTTDQLIAKYKYPAETHYVTTADGYILRMHRIRKSGGIPILLMHGLLDSSAAYILTGPKIALGYYLWDEGYDVWIGNARGNCYSRNHTILNPNYKPFWNFSVHEIGLYDMPAMIDYILYDTGYKKLFYVGHSQGTTSFFIMCSKRPEYNDKIILMHALGPAVYLDHSRFPFNATSPILNLPILYDIFYEAFPRNNLVRKICYGEEKSEIIKFCYDLINMIVGPEKDVDWNIFPVGLGHFPAGASLKQGQHYFQIYYSKKFQEFDYGANGNLNRYGQEHPFEYNLFKVVAPVAVYIAESDYLTAREDIEHRIKKLPNIVRIFRISNCTHLDFTWGKHARKYIYENIVNLSKSFLQKTRTILYNLFLN